MLICRFYYCVTGANPRLDDNLGRSALLEACYHGHDLVIETLKTAGASLAPSSSSTTGRLSTSGSSSSNISGVRSSSIDRNSRALTADLAAAGSFGSLSGLPAGSSAESAAGSLSDVDSNEVSHMGASWALQLASLLCNCVYECNLPVSAFTQTLVNTLPGSGMGPLSGQHLLPIASTNGCRRIDSS